MSALKGLYDKFYSVSIFVLKQIEALVQTFIAGVCYKVYYHEKSHFKVTEEIYS